MTTQDKEDLEKKNTRMMWIATAVIVVILAGGMGANMLFHHDTLGTSVDTDTSSNTMSPK